MASTFIKLPSAVFDLIDDGTTSTTKTWSSSKIQNELDGLGEIYVRSTRFVSIGSGTSGSITLTGTQEIVLDDFGGTTDAVVTTIEGGRPTNEPAQTSSGAQVAATLDASGNWTLSGTPSSYPVALVYRVREQFQEYDDFNNSVMGGLDLQIVNDRNAMVTYNEITSLASGTLATIATYNASGGEKLTRVLFSGTNIATYYITLNGSTVAKTRTNYGEDLSENFNFDPGLTLSNGDIVLVRVEHARTMPGDFNASIITEQ